MEQLSNQNDTCSITNSFNNLGLASSFLSQQQQFFNNQTSFDSKTNQIFNSNLSNDLFMFPQQQLLQQKLLQQQVIQREHFFQQQKEHEEQRKIIQFCENIFPIIQVNDTIDVKTTIHERFNGRFNFLCLVKRGNIITMKRSFGVDEVDYVKELKMIKYNILISVI